MLNYKLLCRDADGNPINSQDVEAASDASAVNSALKLARANIFELWLENRRVAVIEANDACTIDLTAATPRRFGRLPWSHRPHRAQAA